MASLVARGFEGRSPLRDEAERLPPGQHAERGWPVMTVGPTPSIAERDWRLLVDGLVDESVEWSLEDLRAMPGSEFHGDIHCVTAWSKLDTSFGGVSLDAVLEQVRPLAHATHLLATSYGGYSTNLALADVCDGRAWVVWEHEGRPLPREHGGPVRLLVPARYFWKSAKWLRGLRLLDRDEPGFWERNGYHRRGDPWREERYSVARERREWQCCRVLEVRRETPTVTTVRIAVPGGPVHLPGQHYDVRVTASTGYTAARSYSIASSPLDGDWIEITVERLPDGEVSPYLSDRVAPGDEIELRGPLGSYFAWRGEGPLLLVGGGTGVVPLMAMLRHRRHVAPELPVRLLYSARGPDELLYADELGSETTVTYTRDVPVDWTGATGRLDAQLIAGNAFDHGTAFVCGSHGFVDSAANLLIDHGVAVESIKTERFGPTG